MPFTVEQKEKIFICLFKCADLIVGNYKSLIKEIKDLNSLRDSLCSRIVETKL